ncbi:MAG TPA: hypothetical protein VHF45_04200 [Thermoleophilaceae bacterium]|nr:hypothetical protein [Thermoleophilaceae bacterium]
MDEQQDKAFREAVERKKADAKAASEQTQRDHPTAGDPVDGPEQAAKNDAGRTQDTGSIRDKNTRHGKVTADKWNQ